MSSPHVTLLGLAVVCTAAESVRPGPPVTMIEQVGRPLDGEAPGTGTAAARDRLGASGDDVLWDNGLSFLNGLSHLTDPARRSVLDDFTAEETWLITGFRLKFAWSDGRTGIGTDVELDFYGDIDGRPDFDNRFAVSETLSYTETRDPSHCNWFGPPCVDIEVELDQISLSPGTYWLDMHVVGPVNGFQVIGDYPQQRGQPVWVDYQDFGGRQPGRDVFGDDYDVSFVLTGRVLEAVAVPPESFSVRYGAHQSGDVDALLESDDRYVVIQQRPAPAAVLPLVRLEVGAETGRQDASLLIVLAETAATARPDPPPQVLSLLNYDAGEWEIVDERSARLQDTIVHVVIDERPGRFLEPGTGATALRLDWFDPGAVFFSAWGVLVDQAGWLVTPEAP